VGDEIKYVIVNMNEATAVAQIAELQSRITAPIYQDSEELGIWETLDGSKDDILVYDRCGQLTYHVGFPFVYMGYNYTQNSILSTYKRTDPCECDED